MPHVAVTIDLLLAIGGVSMLIYFVHHVAAMIQSSNLVEAVAREFREALDHSYPHQPQESHEHSTAVPEYDVRGAAPVPAGQRGYLQLVDYEGLLEVARANDLQIRVERRPGRFLVPSSVVAHAWPSDAVDERVARRIARHVTSGTRRTPQQDVEFPARQLTEMAVRALSPGINDVVTATICIDHLSDALCEAAGRSLEPRVLRDGDGQVRVWSGDPMEFADLVASYDGIRESAGFHTGVYLHALAALGRVVPCLGRDDRLEAVLRQARLLAEAAEREVAAEEDRELVRDRYAEVLAGVTGPKVEAPRAAD